MRQLRTHLSYFAIIMLLSLWVAGCAQLGLATPQTMNEKIAAAQGTVTEVRKQATALLVAKKISVADAENALRVTDAAEQGIVVTRGLVGQDPSSADMRLKATVATLTALQAYLATKGN